MINNLNTDKTLYQLLQSLLGNIFTTLNCIKIGEIVSFDKTDQTCSVKVLYKPKIKVFKNKQSIVDYPILAKVPCVVMGGGSSYITHPIKAGDQCVLLFSDYMIDNWWATGESRPIDFPRFHDISDAIAIVGLRALPNALSSYSDYLDLHYSDNSSIIIGDTIEVNNQTINLNGAVNVVGDGVLTGALSAASLSATNGATGQFVSADSKTITVTNGIITAIS